MEYFNSLKALDAEESLREFRVIALPKMKNETRRRLLREFSRTITKTVKSKGSKVSSMGSIYEKLASKIKGANG